MKTGHIIFNAVSLVIAGVLLFSALSAYFIVLPGWPPDNQRFLHFLIALEIIVALLVAGGSIGNFAKGGLAGWPTGIVIAGYCISIWLLPFAIWGIVILVAQKRRSKATAKA